MMNALGGKSVLLLSSEYDSVFDNHSSVTEAAVDRKILPLPLKRLAIQLREAGLDVVIDPRAQFIIDNSSPPSPDLLTQYLHGHREQIGMVGVSLPFSEYENSDHGVNYDKLVPILKEIRRLGMPLILGGPGVTLDPGIMGRFRRSVGEIFEGTAALKGEGDFALRDACLMSHEQLMMDDRFMRSLDCRILPGQHVKLTQSELQALTPVEYDYYQKTFMALLEGATRGCFGGCKFCVAPGLNDRTRDVRQFTPEQFVASLRSAVYAGRIYMTLACTDITNVKPKWWREVKRLIDADPTLKAHLPYIAASGATNASRLGSFTPDHLRLLRGLGIASLPIGVQSMWPDTLRYFNRTSFKPDRLKEFIKQSFECGIDVPVDIIVGGPTTEGSQHCLDGNLAMALLIAFWGGEIKAYIYQDYPGSIFHEMGIIPPPLDTDQSEACNAFSWYFGFMRDYHLRRMMLSKDRHLFSNAIMKEMLAKWDPKIMNAIADSVISTLECIAEEHGDQFGITAEEIDLFKHSLPIIMSDDVLALAHMKSMQSVGKRTRAALDDPRIKDNFKNNLALSNTPL